MAEFTLTKQADDVVILDVSKISNICDYYVICSADSETQVKAIHNEVVRKSKDEKIKVQHSEVDKTYNWILVDFSNVILHIFTKSTREFYNLEYLWRQAKKIILTEK
ncbi:MAG: ribosome silencing factor [Candidatus Omnitrophica bacterium]|nr:ribosome silencing factor [Candidatus Omnitrophota bacterium]